MSEPGASGHGRGEVMAGGLLGLFDKTCPYGHGRMQAVDGWWALTGVHVRQANALATLFAPGASITANNQALALEVWRCPSCGNVQLFDPENS